MKLIQKNSGRGCESLHLHHKHSPQVSDDKDSEDEKEFRMLMMGMNRFDRVMSRDMDDPAM